MKKMKKIQFKRIILKMSLQLISKRRILNLLILIQILKIKLSKMQYPQAQQLTDKDIIENQKELNVSDIKNSEKSNNFLRKKKILWHN